MPTQGEFGTAAETAEDAVSDWREIETAPKDGREVLVYDETFHTIEIAGWHVDDYDEGGWQTGDFGTCEPTHWMPLPEPPQ